MTQSPSNIYSSMLTWLAVRFILIVLPMATLVCTIPYAFGMTVNIYIFAVAAVVAHLISNTYDKMTVEISDYLRAKKNDQVSN